MVHLSKLIKIDTIKSTCIVGIDFHRLVKRSYINRLVFIDCIDYIDWFPMNDFHCLGTPVFNQDDSSGSNIFLIHYQHHLWREQFRESRETFQKTFEHIFFVSLAPTPKQGLENNFFRLFQHLAGVCHNAQRDWLRHLLG